MKEFKFQYLNGEAGAFFKVDLDKFTEEMANETLDFFVWDYDENENPIDAVMKKYALRVIEIATDFDYNAYGVKEKWKGFERDGFYEIDGSDGVKLIDAWGYTFKEENLNLLK